MPKRKRDVKPIPIDDPLEEIRNQFSDKNRNRYQSKNIANKPATSGKPDSKPSRLLFAVLCMTIIISIIIVLSTAVVLTQVFDRMASRKEYSSLREIAEFIEIDFDGTESRHIPYLNVFDTEMRQINPDYICWLKIDGTAVDYPVVRASDNDKYLNLSFYGEENTYGTLFMDYRNKGDYVPHIIIYGHNTKTGDMFGGLRNYLDNKYRAEHPVITIKVNGRIVEYEVFAARRTDVSDYAYYLDFDAPGSFRAFAERCGAPPDAVQIITLSTCVSAGNDDERVIVQGVLR
jgi:sortase B